MTGHALLCLSIGLSDSGSFHLVFSASPKSSESFQFFKDMRKEKRIRAYAFLSFLFQRISCKGHISLGPTSHQPDSQMTTSNFRGAGKDGVGWSHRRIKNCLNEHLSGCCHRRIHEKVICFLQDIKRYKIETRMFIFSCFEIMKCICLGLGT